MKIESSSRVPGFVIHPYCRRTLDESEGGMETTLASKLTLTGDQRRERGSCIKALGCRHQQCMHAEQRHLPRPPSGQTCSKVLTRHKHTPKATHPKGAVWSIYSTLFVSLLFFSLSKVTLAASSHNTTQSTSIPLYHKPLNWKSIDVRTVDATPRTHHNPRPSQLNLPDKSATVGRLFFYQISLGNGTTYQASEAGRPSLPRWLHFDKTSGTFMGIPLQSDHGKLYISVDARHRDAHGGMTAVRNGVFLLEVGEWDMEQLHHNESVGGESSNLRKTAEKPDANTFAASDSLLLTPKAKCIGGHSPRLPLPNLCAPKMPTVLANLVFLADFSSMDPLQRSTLFLAVSRHLGICSEALAIRPLDWSGKEGGTIWTQLIESDFNEYFGLSTTVLSFPVACGSIKDSFEALFTSLESLVTDEDGEMTLKGGSANECTITYNQWFLSTDLAVIFQSKSRSTTTSRRRLRRQVMEFALETVPPPIVSSTPIPQGSSPVPSRNTLVSQSIVLSSVSPAPSPSSESSSASSSSFSLLVIPPTRVIPTSEASRTLFTASPSPSFGTALSTTVNVQTSVTFEPATSLPVMTLSFSPSLLDRTSVVMTIIPTRSFTIRSSIEVPTSSSPLTTASIVPPTTTEIFMFSTTPVVEPTPTFSESPLLPMSSAELTMSISVFTPMVSPLFSSFTIPESTTIILLPTETFIPPTSMFPMITASSVSTSVLMLTQLETSPVFTVGSSATFPLTAVISSGVVSSTVFLPSSFPTLSPSSSLSFPETSFVLETSSFTSALSPSPTSQTRTMLMPMSSEELTLSLSIFTPSVSLRSSVIDLTTTMIIFPTETDVPAFTSSLVFEISSSIASVSSTPLAFSSLPTPTSSPVSSIGVTPSPTPVSICDLVSCGNGTCIDMTIGFECVCYPGWTGDLCETDIDFCNPFPCFQNNTISCIDGNSTYTCNCDQGYAGINCTVDTDPCDPNPCFNNGTCNLQPVGEFRCVCPRGVSGTLCEFDFDPCTPDPCDIGEICIDLGRGGFFCSTIFATTSITFSSSSAIDSSSLQGQSSAIVSIPMSTSNISLSPSSTPLSPSPLPNFSSRSFPVRTASPTPTSTSSPSLFLSPPLSPTPSPSPSASPTPSPSPSLSPTPSPSPSASPTPSPSPSASPTPSMSSLSVLLSQTPTPSPSISSLSSPTPSSSPIQNNPPLLLNPIGTILLNEGQPFQFAIQEDTFFDPEDGLTSNLTLSLLDSNGNPISNTSWIQLRGNTVIEGLPLSSQVQSGAITDYVFILRAQDSLGTAAHDFVTVRVLPQANVANFVVVFFEGDFAAFSENLTAKIELASRLSTVSGGLTTNDIYVREFRSGSIGVVYSNLLISALSCTDFQEWVRTFYQDGQYTLEFLQAIAPFQPTISAPFIEGPCLTVSVNVLPTLEVPPEIDTQSQSDILLLLATIIPMVVISLLLLLLGLLCFLFYRRKRKERDYLHDDWQARAFLNRRPVILSGEMELPPRGRRPIVLPNEAAQSRRAGKRWRIGQPVPPPPPPPHLEVEDVDRVEESSSDEELVDIPFLSAHYRQPLHKRDPPRYRLPPDYFPIT